MDIAINIKTISTSLPGHVKLIAVSKTQSENTIMEAYNTGHRYFGENRAQELSLKHQHLPKDIEWHMIGHMQTNKVKTIAGFVSYIHSVDSFKLLNTINSAAHNHKRTINCLLQVHIAQETTKYGFSFDEVDHLLSNVEFNEYHNINIVGLMGMATFTKEISIIKSEFIVLSQFFNRMSAKYGHLHKSFKELSMGMSGDYSIAIEEGSTMVRIGSKIFGQRN